ncbi:hypothetical protein [Brevundimonas sp.]|uniref:hypothetical protein n=1 Tax=Brevundimonas sp. TaxID=1871086 RepID=UPI0035B41B86
MAGGWWTAHPEERFWLEATDRSDIGADLKAPLRDASGKSNWRYTLFQQTKPGDTVFHYDSSAQAIVSRSRVAGAPVEAPIVWAARGSYARGRGARPKSVPGYRVPLSQTEPLPSPITLDQLRARKGEMMQIVEAVREAHGGGPAYFPFELSKRPVRPMQGYAFKLPAAFLKIFDLEASTVGIQTYRLSTSAKEIRRHFNAWRKAMLETAERETNLWHLPVEGIVITNYPDRSSTRLGSRTALGVDRLGRSWGLQMNETEKSGDPNITTGIAIGDDARPYLLRQGRLQSGGGDSERVSEQQFRDRTGAVPVLVTNGDTPGRRREWYVVTALDVSGDEIRRKTAAFVELCMLARDPTPAKDPEKKRLIETLFAGAERGGSYRIAGRPATVDRDVLRIQGEVWIALAAVLKKDGIALTKPRPARRYEVDGVVVNGKVRLLIEIKCSNAAADVYTGVGQLLLYRQMLDSLQDHNLVLMLPEAPAPALADAVEALGVTIATYEARPVGKRIKVEFPGSLRQLCGLGVGNARRERRPLNHT